MSSGFRLAALGFRLAVLALVVACGKSATKPPPDAAPVKKIDAAVVAPDAAVKAVEKPTVTKIAAGDRSICAVMSDETLRCWGANSGGELGTGTTTDSATPVTPALRGVKDVVLGGGVGCALLDDGSVACWGQIGIGKKGPLLAPTAATGVRDAQHLFVIGHAACASEGGALVCWGDVDAKGHLRLSTGGNAESRPPTAVAGLDHVAALTANGALHEDGTVSYWGSDGVPQKTPLAGIKEIASTGDGVCGLHDDGSVECASASPHCAASVKREPAKKESAKKEPAKKQKKSKKKPVAPPPPPPPAFVIETLHLPKARHLAFDVGLCVVSTAGKLQCLDTSDACKLASPWPGLAKLDSVQRRCARSTDGSVRCWTVETRARTVSAISGVSAAAQIAVAVSLACALVPDHTVACWGDDKQATPLQM